MVALHSSGVAARGTTTPRTLREQGKLAFAMGYNPGDRIRVANALNPAGVPWRLALMPTSSNHCTGVSRNNTPTFISAPRLPESRQALLN